MSDETYAAVFMDGGQPGQSIAIDMTACNDQPYTTLTRSGRVTTLRRRPDAMIFHLDDWMPEKRTGLYWLERPPERGSEITIDRSIPDGDQLTVIMQHRREVELRASDVVDHKRYPTPDGWRWMTMLNFDRSFDWCVSARVGEHRYRLHARTIDADDHKRSTYRVRFAGVSGESATLIIYCSHEREAWWMFDNINEDLGGSYIEIDRVAEFTLMPCGLTDRSGPEVVTIIDWNGEVV
ncbi:MAG: hypothetical protein COA96_16950 [SAR86 cluster bacterium]|uniref:Uncharacterized protein n=1 Tax=SAR86 cluster bacterium TaxID=2030880 RepID=A0A2A5AG49_9GAMM|nr:MAG: hypothetical protein COA96_16950 [SAR86 cluster bacterium]